MKILYFSLVNWNWIKQRPHFIAENLAKMGLEVEFISLFPIGKKREKHITSQIVNVKTFNVLPLSSKISIIEKINVLLVSTLLKNRTYDIIILNHPFQIKYIPQNLKKRAAVIYDCMDNIPCFYNSKTRKKVIARERDLIEGVDIIITSSDNLKTELIKRYELKNKQIKTINNALDKDTFLDCLKKTELKKPNLMYVGTIGKWLDFDVLNLFAVNNPNYTIYLIGPYERKALGSPKNVVYYGTIPHSEVSTFVSYGDIMLLPFVVDDLIKSVDPVKLYEYIALNKPVISSYWNEIKKFDNYNIKFYNNINTFTKYVHELSEDICNTVTINYEFIERNNWEERTKEYFKVLNTIAGRKMYERK